MCRMGVAQENGAHILCQIALLQFALQCALCNRRNGRSRRNCRTVHIFPDSFSVFLPSSLYTRILLAATLQVLLYFGILGSHSSAVVDSHIPGCDALGIVA